MTLPLVVFPNATEVVVDYLTTEIRSYRAERYTDGVLISSRSMKPKPSVFVYVERVGGVRTLISVDQPRLEFQVWHQTDEEAHDLAQLLRGLVHRMPGKQGDHTVTRVVDVAGPYRSPDLETNRPRYRFTVELGIHHRTDIT